MAKKYDYVINRIAFGTEGDRLLTFMTDYLFELGTDLGLAEKAIAFLLHSGKETKSSPLKRRKVLGQSYLFIDK